MSRGSASVDKLDPDEQAALAQMMRAQLGPRAHYQLYDRFTANSMTFVLDLVERHIRTPVQLYWIGGGLPEMFCLSGFSAAVVAFGSRYIELTRLARQVYGDSLLEGGREEVAKRICLKTIANFALRNGTADLAVAAFVTGVVGQTMVLFDSPLALVDADDAPIDATYVALWFYGLLHELGHFAPPLDSDSGPLSDDSLRNALARSLAAMPLPAEMKRRVARAAAASPSDHVLGLMNLRREVSADVVAISLSVDVARQLMAREGAMFQPVEFAREVMASFAIMALIEQCRQTARAAARRDVEAFESIGLLQVAIGVRTQVIRLFLQLALASSQAGFEKPGPEQLERADAILDRVNRALHPAVVDVERALGTAIRFALYGDGRDPGLLSQLLREAAWNPVHAMEIERFVGLADGFDVSSSELEMLRTAITRRAALPLAETAKQDERLAPPPAPTASPSTSSCSRRRPR